MIEERRYAGFLFDMDGTLLDSTAVIHRVWGKWALEHGFDPARFIETIHGIRAEDVIARSNIPGLDVEAETKLILAAENADVSGIIPIRGVVDFLQSLPSERWAIVTSAPRELAVKRLACVGISIPDVLITAEDVVHGKPNPECFRLGAARLGLQATDCLVFEDAAAGIAAGEAAGSDVLLVASVKHAVTPVGRQFINDYEGLIVDFDASGIRLRFRPSVVDTTIKLSHPS